MESSTGEMTIPIFAHLRSDFLNKKTSPFVAFNIGYNFSLDGYYGGLMMEPSLGASFNVGHKYRMTAGLGFAVDRVLGYYYSFYYGPYIFNDWAFALNIKIGFSF